MQIQEGSFTNDSEYIEV